MAEAGRFTPVQRDSTPALIAGQLREAVKDGRLAPGAQLSESQLSAQFGVSRGPLREAMQRLDWPLRSKGIVAGALPAPVEGAEVLAFPGGCAP